MDREKQIMSDVQNTLALLKRLQELRAGIKEFRADLSADNDSGAWCLGDPYEALERMESESAEIEYQLLGIQP